MNRKQRRAAAKRGQSSVGVGGTAAPAAAALIAEWLQTGVKHHSAGQLAAAEACYRQVLAVQPQHADALHLLGVSARQAGRAEIAVELIDRAIRLNGRDPYYFLDRAAALQEMKRFDEALKCYDKALALRPGFAEVFYSRGLLLKALMRPDEALASFGTAIALKPEFPEALNNRAAVLLDLQQFDEALAAVDKALVLRPDYPEACTNRGVALLKLKQPEPAAASFDRALALRPNFAEAWNLRGLALHELQRFEDALASYDKALALKPDYPEVFVNRGVALLELRQIEHALASFNKALELRPDFVEAWSNRGSALQHMKQFGQALECHDKALAIEPDYVEALYNRGVTLRQLDRFEEALTSLEKLVQLQPGQADALGALGEIILCVTDLCDWDRRAALAKDVMLHVNEKKSKISPFAVISRFGDPALQMQCGKNFIAHEFPALPSPLRREAKCRRDKLRIAYLSADFRQHATTLLAAELFERHDRSRFEVIAVSFGMDDGSEMRKRLIGAFDQFIEVGRMSDDAAARRLHDLQVAIAVDLKGHTEDLRLGILARRPAPIQVSYLGYPATMGAPFIDYIIADRIVAPFEHHALYTEKIVHLPVSYQVNDTKRRIATQTPARQQAGLPIKGFVFCCFNQSYKITSDVFDVWMRLLHAVDGSVLWLLRDHETAVRNLRREAQQRGIDPLRLVFADRLPNEEHLARHRLADLFLDTLPCNAHTTASDALWAGLPLVTCLGEAFAGRVGASLLDAIGLPELVTQDIGAYEALALRLAQDPPLLAAYRNRLAANRLTHPLFDADRFRRHIEAAYLEMWEIWQRGEQPRSFAVAAEPVHSPPPIG